MGWPALLVLVRHGESEGNIRTAVERTEYDVSTASYPLTPRGREQAKMTGEYLHNRFGTFDAYYASYYTRSIETLRLMYPEAKIYEDPRIAEGQRGIWHQITVDQMKQRFPEEIHRREREGLYHYRPFGGENWPDIELRIHSFLGTLSRDYDGKKVLVVGHGHWFILFQRLIHRHTIEETMQRHKAQRFQNTSVTIYQSVMDNGKPRLQLMEENIVPWEGKLSIKQG